jgi:malonyl-CoA O-methyltransferase
MQHVLRSGGYAVVTTFTQRTLHELRESFRAVDQREHLSPFLTMNQIAVSASSAGFKVKQIHEYNMTEHYSDVIALMKSIKAIGARMKSRMPGVGMMTPRQLQRVQAAYEASYATDKGLPATWRILRLVMQKP